MVAGGVCMVAGGHAWLLGACMVVGGACVVAGRGHAWLWGCAWLQRGVHGCGVACMVAGGCEKLQGGGMHGCRGACMVVGGMCGLGGMCGCGGVCVVVGGCAWLWGVCMVARGMHGCGGTCMGYDKIQSMSGRYASYWNAFLYAICFHDACRFPSRQLVSKTWAETISQERRANTRCVKVSQNTHWNFKGKRCNYPLNCVIRPMSLFQKFLMSN